jgi:hypothetical protein
MLPPDERSSLRRTKIKRSYLLDVRRLQHDDISAREAKSQAVEDQGVERMNAIRCKKCGDVLKFEKIRRLRYCSCRTVAVDWSLFCDNYRILGNAENYERVVSE